MEALFYHSPTENPLSQSFLLRRPQHEHPKTVTGAALKSPLALVWLNMDYSDHCVTLIPKAAVIHTVRFSACHLQILFYLIFTVSHVTTTEVCLSVSEEEMKIRCHLNSRAIIKSLYLSLIHI